MPTFAEACGWSEEEIVRRADTLVSHLRVDGLNPAQAAGLLAAALAIIGADSPSTEILVEDVLRETLNALDEVRAKRTARGTPAS